MTSGSMLSHAIDESTSNPAAIEYQQPRATGWSMTSTSLDSPSPSTNAGRPNSSSTSAHPRWPSTASLPMIDCRLPPGSVGQTNAAAVNEPRAASADVSVTIAHEPGWIGWKWPSCDTVGGMVDHLLLPSRSRRVVIAVDQPNEVELERPRIVHRRHRSRAARPAAPTRGSRSRRSSRHGLIIHESEVDQGGRRRRRARRRTGSRSARDLRRRRLRRAGRRGEPGRIPSPRSTTTNLPSRSPQFRRSTLTTSARSALCGP